MTEKERNRDGEKEKPRDREKEKQKGTETDHFVLRAMSNPVGYILIWQPCFRWQCGK